MRVFAIRGGPQNGSGLPGILHIHGGGQTASLDWVRFWAKRGYVCVTFDYTGPWAGRKEYTDWGPIKQGNLTDAQGGLIFRPTARASALFHWAMAARRALTLLSYHPKVDRERLGIFGVSIGGTLCWLVAATDERVKTSVPIYGCGYNYDQKKTVWGFPEVQSGLALFNRVLAPEAYAASIRGPVLFLDATNDFHGWMDDAYDILSQTHVTHRLAFTPRTTTTSTRPSCQSARLDGLATQRRPPLPGRSEARAEILPDEDPVATVLPDRCAARGTRWTSFIRWAKSRPPTGSGGTLNITHASTVWKAELPIARAHRQMPGVRQRVLPIGRVPEHEPGPASLHGEPAERCRGPR